ncbi:MAG: hypothetical protein J6K05_04770 [Bacteroidaceae bacterium]|nr:hypothetical protein [Bacteroidaceae bacterium]MBR3757817.1 hypothetical protein [Bacteroidaceae bacterium]
MNRTLFSTLMIIGALLLLAGAALMITGWTLAPYLFCVGALLFAAMQMTDRYEGQDITVKRLRRQQLIGSLMLLVTGVLMFVERHNGWIVTLTIAAVIQLYTAFRMPEKE